MFLEKHNIKSAFGPVDANGAAVVGARVSMKECKKVTVVVEFGASLTGAVSEVSFNQHTASTAGTSKKLVLKNPYFKKVGTATAFTKVEAPVEADEEALAYTVDLSTDLDTAKGVAVFEIDADQLDTNGAFTHVSVDLADAEVSKLVSGVYILGDNDQNPPYSKSI